LNTKKDEALEEKFLGSFVLPEKSAEVQANVAAGSEKQEAPRAQADPANLPADVSDTAAQRVEATGGADGRPTKPKSISGGVLNGKAVSLPPPTYPPLARKEKASGTVVVQVTIDENGNVVEAAAVSGHPLLQQAAVAAARQAKFPPTRLMGEPIKVTGVLQYDFVPE
jgi:TonB family protein